MTNTPTIMTRLHSSRVTFLLIGLAVAAIGAFVIRDLRRATRETWQMHTELVHGLDLITELQYQTQEARRSMLYSLTTTDPNLQINYAEGSRAADKRVSELIAEYLTLTRSSAGAQAGRRLGRDWGDYAKIRDEVAALILEGSVKDAVRLDLRDGVPSFNRVRDDVRDVEQIYKERAELQFSEVRTAFNQSILKLGVILCLTFLFATVAVRQLQKGQMLQAVQQSEARLREVIESINEGMCVVGRDGRVDLWNRAAERSLKRQRQDVVGHALLEGLPELQESRLPAAITEARQTGRSAALEDLRLSLDEAQHVFEARIFPFEGGTTIFFNDVTERKRAERRLAAQHAATRALAESDTLAEASPKILKAVCENLDWDLGIVWEVDQQTATLTSVNAWHSHQVQAPEFAEATRWTQLARGVGLPGIVWEKGKPNWIPDVLTEPNFHRDRFTTKTGLHGALAFPLQTSRQVIGVMEFLNCQVQQVDDDLLKMLGAIGSQIGQFAERKRTERVQAATYRAAEAANAAPSLEDLFRLTHAILGDLMPAKNFYVALYDPDAEVLRFPYFVDEYDLTPAPRNLRKGLTEYVLRTGRPLLASPEVFEELKKEGEIEAISTPGVDWLGVPLKKGASTFGVLVVQSYTEGVRLGEEEQKILTFVAAQIAMAIERKRAEEELKSALQMKSDFVSFATHQLRTPLAGIKWSLELAAQEEGLPEETAAFIQDGRDSAQRLVGMVNDLLDVSRLESGKLKLAPKETNLAELTQSVLKDVSHQIEKQGHQLSVTGMEGVPPILVDPQLFRQVILNLVSNAIKYTPSGGSIGIRIDQENGLVRWAIEDSGIGIPKANQARLFEKFYRAENVYKVETEGTGLGLHLVKMIVEKSGGRIWCESEENKGSTFWFTLPLGGGNS